MDNVKDISNLIADMVFKGATEDDVVKAVRYSVDVMDAEKSVAIMDQSYIDNDISELKKKYQNEVVDTDNLFPGYKFDKNSEPNYEVGMAKEPVNFDIPSIHPGMNEIGSDAVKELYHDPVNHPSHYTQGGIECIEAIESACTGLSGDEGYYVGQVIKYIWRWKHKNGLQDLEKAEWYLDRLIGNVTAEVIADDLEARNSQ